MKGEYDYVVRYNNVEKVCDTWSKLTKFLTGLKIGTVRGQMVITKERRKK
jgi:hypothetical protein